MCTGLETLMLASAATSAVGTVMQGQSARARAEAEAGIDELQAAQTQDAARQHAQRIRRAAQAERGAARAQLAASGVKVDEGSALEIDRQILKTSEEDAFMALLNGDRAAQQLRSRAAMSRMGGRAATRNAWLGATSTLIGAGYDYSRWQDVKQQRAIRRGGVW